MYIYEKLTGMNPPSSRSRRDYDATGKDGHDTGFLPAFSRETAENHIDLCDPV
jgi:hypothetical protein